MNVAWIVFITILTVIFISQYLNIVIKLNWHDYKTKREFIFDLIPGFFIITFIKDKIEKINELK